MTRVADLLPEAFVRLLPGSLAEHRANWIEVARKDVADSQQSWVLWLLCGAFASVAVLGSLRWVLEPGFRMGEMSYVFGLGTTAGTLRWLVPLTALVLGYGAVVGEREAGSLRPMLGLPITRSDVLVGKLLQRSIALVVTLSAGLVFAGAVLWYFFAGFDPGAYVTFVGLTLLYGLIFVASGIGLSALCRSRARAAAAAVSTFVLVGFVWRFIPKAAFYLVYGQLPGEASLSQSPAWFVFLGNVDPTQAYPALVQEWATSFVPTAGTGGVPLTARYVGHTVSGSVPFYLHPGFVFLVLVLWGLVPLALGAWRFSRSDLG